MTTRTLDELSWPEVDAAIAGGRRTVVVAFGATEQHGHHLPLAVDRLIGEHLAARLAERLDAFVAPTVAYGCSEHHLAFPGTISVSERTFTALVHDVVSSLAGSGFERLVLVPSHGGNFGPLGRAVASLPARENLRVDAITDIAVLAAIARCGEEHHGVPLGEGGLHAGEWETSMMLVVRPDLVHMDRSVPGFVGDPFDALSRAFDGIDKLTATGVIGDGARADPAHGERYWELAVDLAEAAVGRR